MRETIGELTSDDASTTRTGHCGRIICGRVLVEAGRSCISASRWRVIFAIRIGNPVGLLASVGGWLILDTMLVVALLIANIGSKAHV